MAKIDQQILRDTRVPFSAYSLAGKVILDALQKLSEKHRDGLEIDKVCDVLDEIAQNCQKMKKALQDHRKRLTK